MRAEPAVAVAAIPELRLKRGEDRRLSAGHLWVFSNEVDTDATPLTSFAPGDQVRVVSDRDRFLGYAYVNPRSLICARIVNRDAANPIGKSLLVHRLRVALSCGGGCMSSPIIVWSTASRMSCPVLSSIATTMYAWHRSAPPAWNA